MTSYQPIRILIADDDPDDCLLMRDAFEENRLVSEVSFVHDGVELLEHLKGCVESETLKLPGLILLDLNMPLMDGREALQVIKTDAQLRSIPVVVLSTSSEARDVADSYEHGANAYVTKPSSYSDLTRVAQTLSDHWLETVQLPGEPNTHER
ncbi:response regulator [Pseudomonas zhanjiangensis]|uniref:Response regulator n=1 Tax=Pseudomonas zhanjiangensis TaxID=3239015 RepID=A0ABV3YYM1_9PSED